nr:hypothetical protein [Tanacetum cinerariifolium]
MECMGAFSGDQILKIVVEEVISRHLLMIPTLTNGRGTKSQPKSLGKNVQSGVPEFEILKIVVEEVISRHLLMIPTLTNGRGLLPQILLVKVSNFALLVIEKMIEESLNQVNLAKVSSQPKSTYEAAATLTEFELKKILIDKMNTSESYLIAPEHQECYDGLIKSYHLDKDFFSS